jgi:4-hydroxybenzoate polyprenyltransferase
MTGSASDIPRGNWIDRGLPARARPYARLARFDRPIGVWLLLLPCWWGVALATPGWPDPGLLALFLAGALVMRGAGCTLNDIADRDFDRRVARTRDRPIPSGQVSVLQACVFAAALCGLGLLILLQFNPFTVAVGAASLLLVGVYPFAKRITDWPQAVLGLTFNWGALVGWSAVTGTLALPPLLLYAAGVFWTLAYDTIYAHQDKDDDLLVGVKSTALRLGSHTRPWLLVFFAAAVALASAAAWSAGLAWPFAPLMAAAALHFAWQALTVDLDDAHNCLAKFRANRHAGLLIFAAIVVGQIARGAG